MGLLGLWCLGGILILPFLILAPIGNTSTSIVNEHHSHSVSMEYEDDGLLKKYKYDISIEVVLLFLLHGP